MIEFGIFPFSGRNIILLQNSTSLPDKWVHVLHQRWNIFQEYLFCDWTNVVMSWWLQYYDALIVNFFLHVLILSIFSCMVDCSCELSAIFSLIFNCYFCLLVSLGTAHRPLPDSAPGSQQRTFPDWLCPRNGILATSVKNVKWSQMYQELSLLINSKRSIHGWNSAKLDKLVLQ